MQKRIAFRKVAQPSCDLRELSAASRVVLSCLVIVLERFVWLRAKCRRQIFLYLLDRLKSLSLQRGFKFLEEEKVCWGKVRRVGRLRKDRCLMFGQEVTNQQRRMSWCIDPQSRGVKLTLLPPDAFLIFLLEWRGMTLRIWCIPQLFPEQSNDD